MTLEPTPEGRGNWSRISFLPTGQHMLVAAHGGGPAESLMSRIELWRINKSSDSKEDGGEMVTSYVYRETDDGLPSDAQFEFHDGDPWSMTLAVITQV